MIIYTMLYILNLTGILLVYLIYYSTIFAALDKTWIDSAIMAILVASTFTYLYACISTIVGKKNKKVI